MAWVLRFDGVNDYADTPSWTPTSGDWSFEFKFTVINTEGFNSVVFSNGSHTDGIYLNYNSSGVANLYCGGKRESFGTLAPGETYIARLVSTSGVVEYFKDGVSIASAVTSCDPAIARMNFGRRVENSSQHASVDVFYADFTDDLTPSNSRNYDPTASDHSNTGVQPVLVDTVGSNDATGSGFPTDGSAWVDLGGGGGEILAIDSGSYTLTGSNVSLTAQYKSTLESGSYSLSGNALGLMHESKLIADSGTYSLTGTQVNLTAARKIIADSGSYNLTGTDVTLVYTPSGGGEVLSIDSGTFSLSGSDIGLKAARLISLNTGSYNLTGQSVALRYNAKTIIDGGSYALTGSNINLFANRVIIASSGSYTLSGTSVILKYSGDTYKTIGTVTAGFAQDRYSAEYKLNTITVNFKD